MDEIISEKKLQNFENFIPENEQEEKIIALAMQFELIENKNCLEKNFSKRLQICSIAKREEEIFLPNEKNPILFEK